MPLEPAPFRMASARLPLSLAAWGQLSGLPCQTILRLPTLAWTCATWLTRALSSALAATLPLPVALAGALADFAALSLRGVGAVAGAVASGVTVASGMVVVSVVSI